MLPSFECLFSRLHYVINIMSLCYQLTPHTISKIPGTHISAASLISTCGIRVFSKKSHRGNVFSFNNRDGATLMTGSMCQGFAVQSKRCFGQLECKVSEALLEKVWKTWMHSLYSTDSYCLWVCSLQKRNDSTWKQNHPNSPPRSYFQVFVNWVLFQNTCFFLKWRRISVSRGPGSTPLMEAQSLFSARE